MPTDSPILAIGPRLHSRVKNVLFRFLCCVSFWLDFWIVDIAVVGVAVDIAVVVAFAVVLFCFVFISVFFYFLLLSFLSIFSLLYFTRKKLKL